MMQSKNNLLTYGPSFDWQFAAVTYHIKHLSRVDTSYFNAIPSNFKPPSQPMAAFMAVQNGVYLPKSDFDAANDDRSVDCWCLWIVGAFPKKIMYQTHIVPSPY